MPELRAVKGSLSVGKCRRPGPRGCGRLSVAGGVPGFRCDQQFISDSIVLERRRSNDAGS